MKKYVVLFVSIFAVYSLFSWNYFLKISPNFHFVDLAESFLHLRLDTDTPKRNSRSVTKKDPIGFRTALKRIENGGGWNDWASYHKLKLTDGTEVKGVWPWGDTKSGNKNLFRTLDNNLMIIDKNHDIATGCGAKWKKCDEKVYFVSFPPFPALLMLPIVAVIGYRFNDVIFTLIFAAFNIVLLFFLLNFLSKKGYSIRNEKENLLLALLFAFGTGYFFSSIRGEVWFTALVIGVTLNLLFLWVSIDLKHPILAGIVISAGFLTRTPLIFISLFFILQVLFYNGKLLGAGWKRTIIYALQFGTPILITLILVFVYNYLRFHNFFEFGHSYLMDGQRPSIRDHGLFSFYFLNQNLSAFLTNFPLITGTPPFFKITKHGLGLLVSSPFLIKIIRMEKLSHLAKITAVTAIVAMMPALFYQNTGWAQFTYRFALDYMPLLFVLLALDKKPLNSKWFIIAAIFAVVINTFGAISFGRLEGIFYY